MARYRKVDVRVHSDARFRRLSPVPPCGQGLWLRLLTAPEMCAVPGAIPIGEMAMAEALGWELEAFREAFREVLSEGMAKADWKARLIWIPKAINYNPPQSLNVVKSWAMAWDELPECGLKVEAHQTLKAFLQGMGEAFLHAFEESCGKACAIQEHEHEHEQKTPTPPTPTRAREDDGPSDPRLTPVPQDFEAGESLRLWARHLRLTDQQIDEAQNEFVRYWTARGEERVNWRSVFMERLKDVAKGKAIDEGNSDAAQQNRGRSDRAAVINAIYDPIAGNGDA